MSRVRVTEDEFGGLRVTIGPRRAVPTALYQFMWCIAWVAGEFYLLFKLFDAELAKAEAIHQVLMMICVVFFTYLGFMVIRVWLLNLFGREILILGETQLEIRTEIMGPIGGIEVFERPSLRNLRYSPTAPDGRISGSFRNRMANGLVGTVAFDWRGKTYRFGAGLSETDAKRLILTIRNYFPIEDDALEPFPVTR